MASKFDQNNPTLGVGEETRPRSIALVAEELTQQEVSVETFGPNSEYEVRSELSKDNRAWRYLTAVFYNDTEVEDDVRLVRVERSHHVDLQDTKEIEFQDFANEAAEQHLKRCASVLEHVSTAQGEGSPGKRKFAILAILIVIVLCVGLFAAYKVYQYDPWFGSDESVEPAKKPQNDPEDQITPAKKEQLMKIIKPD